MARARNIKPGFFANELLVELEFSTRLLFIGLWTEADKAGRIEDRPKRIKMALFPADNLDVDAMLNELAALGFIRRYERDGIKAIQIVNWAKHQNPHHTEKASVIPPEHDSEESAKKGGSPVDNGELTVKQQEQDGGNPADSLIPDSLIQEEEHVDAAASTRPAPEADQSAQLLQLDRIPYEKIRDLYNRILGGTLKRCLGVTDQHRKHIRAAYNLRLDNSFPVREGGLDFWEGLFNDVLDCPFMLGKNDRGWRADFEFLTTAAKIQRFMEGKYDAA